MGQRFATQSDVPGAAREAGLLRSIVASVAVGVQDRSQMALGRVAGDIVDACEDVAASLAQNLDVAPRGLVHLFIRCG